MFTKFEHLDLDTYVLLLKAMSSLSGLFSNTDKPYIPYRFAENLFLHCVKQCYSTKDLSRADNSFDSIVEGFSGDCKAGVGVKTFVTASTSYKDEKVAEFTKYAGTHNLKSLATDDLVHTVAQLRNERVISDAVEYGIDLDKSFYHCLIRDKNSIFIHEEPYPIIDLDHIELLKKNDSKVSSGMIAFSDGLHIYKYNTAKNVLYKRFELSRGANSHHYKMPISSDPFKLLASLLNDRLVQQNTTTIKLKEDFGVKKENREFIVLPLYKTRSSSTIHEVAEKSGINQWNADGRPRKFGEAYIPVPKALLDKRMDFFPFINSGKEKIEERFTLILPTGKSVSAKLCQANWKALMSDPNDVLISWIYKVIDGSLEKAQKRFDPLNRLNNRPYTYNDLLKIGKDAVFIFKNNRREFEICFAPLGAYDVFAKLNFAKIPFDIFEENYIEHSNKTIDYES